MHRCALTKTINAISHLGEVFLFYFQEFQTTGDNRMVGPLGKVASPFRLLTCKRGENCTTTTRWRDIGAVVSLRALSLARSSSSYMLTTSLRLSPRKPTTHFKMLMNLPSGPPPLIHWKLLTPSRRPPTTSKNKLQKQTCIRRAIYSHIIISRAKVTGFSCACISTLVKYMRTIPQRFNKKNIIC